MTTSYTPEQTANDVRVMAGCNDALLAVGRIALAVIFVMSGLTKFMDLSATAGAVASKGLPMPMVMAALAAAAELGGGLLIVIGWQTRLVALGLVVFTLITTYLFHPFWAMEGAAREGNMIHALKNLSIMGGFLMLAAVGAGRYSVDGPCTVHATPNNIT
jgi:putative oxidoreductase